MSGENNNKTMDAESIKTDPICLKGDNPDEDAFDQEDEADEAARQYLDEDDDEYSPLGAAIFREMTGMEIDDEEDEGEEGGEDAE